MTTHKPLRESPVCCVPKGAFPKSPTSIANPEISDQSRRSAIPARTDLPGGWFMMGADDGPYPQDGEGPVRQVFVDPFSISRTAVTNAEYYEFVAATGYKSAAEEAGWSFVFHLNVCGGVTELNRVRQAPWWCKIDGANWSQPEGEGSSIEGRSNHPVVHMTLRDALAYCSWANCRLPTEAEWEFAARGGLERKPYPWGDHLEPNDEPMANVWQGAFPDKSSKLNIGTEPVTHYRANGYALHNMIGNVWEWTGDRFTQLHSPKPVKNPKGPLNGQEFVAKGGSYLCHQSYCLRYRTSSRQRLDPMTMAGNIGFRTAGISEPTIGGRVHNKCTRKT